MNFEPQKFFIGLIDFFSVLLPGALLTYVIKGPVGSALPLDIKGMSDAHAWLIFFFGSYLLGHFIFLVGSWLDVAYDHARKAAPKANLYEATVTTRFRRLPFHVQRFLLRLVFKDEENTSLNCATAIKRRYLGPLDAVGAMNTFQWSKLRLAIDKPDALASVQRFEADSKFFRSLFVVLILILVVERDHVRMYFYIWLGLLLMALWRYMEQRHKATSQAYWAVITFEGQQLAKTAPEPLTHAGGVVYRQAEDGAVAYLLVAATRNPDERVLPKGRIECGETPRETAVREVFEESGVFARVESDIGEVSYVVDGEQVRVRFYVMKALGQAAPVEPRNHAWHTLESAILVAKHEQNKMLLASADRLRAHRGG